MARKRRSLVLGGVLLSALACAVTLAAAPPTLSVRGWRQAHEIAIVRELATLVAIPNVASDRPNIDRNVEALRAMLERRGVSVRVLDNNPWPPAVYGELKSPGAKRTLMLYAHYDGQPVDAREWRSDPWTPTLRVPAKNGWRDVPMPTSGKLDPETRMYGRSSSDDKAPIVAMLSALDALRAARRQPSVNLKFFFEGEEEAGSTHLGPLLRRHVALLDADAWIFADGPVHQSRRPQVVYGVRGVMGLELTVHGPSRALHSGHYGNWAPNPAALLAGVVAGMRDGDGKILIDGFYGDVVPPTAAERVAIAKLPPIDASLRKDLSLGASEDDNAALGLRIMLPALNVRGLESGHVGALAANAVPPVARASIDFRLVPNQKPARVRELVEAHLRKHGWFVTRDSVTEAVRLAHPRVIRVEWDSGYPAVRTPMDLPVSIAIRRTLDELFGKPVIAVPTLGGSLPLSAFDEALDAPLVILPIVNHDNNQHAKDENVRLQNLWDGIEIFAALMTRLSDHWRTVK